MNAQSPPLAPSSSSTHCGLMGLLGACGAPVPPGAELNLCLRHHLAAYDWVSRDVGVTDVLPSPCLACGSRLGVRYPSGWLCAVCEWKVGDLPDGIVASTRLDVVYYLRAGQRIKIGTSANPRARLAQLSFDDLLAFERGNRLLEQQRHSQFAAHRIGRGEWFDTNDELLAHIELLRAGVDDPWNSYSLWVSEHLATHG
ncbi:GIY-YIG nuclease family protein [Agreia pratensis]|uniref:GIY-YIG nuclease family protein n=1 Tax=Agreia pratensis TaxID=150121 RepID=UPI001E4F6CBF|nr:GIY-YIG nuclease family protein [Agreia pratensis]